MYTYNERFSQITEQQWNTVEAVVSISEERGVKSDKVACAWLLSRRAVSSVLGGANSLEQMKTYIGAAEVKLTGEETAQLDEVSRSEFNPPWPPQLVV